MARRVFFSFHYNRDVWRANQIRNSWLAIDSAGFIDAADFEAVERKGQDAVRRWIRDQLDGTSVTAVLIGAETASREYVQYEITQSWDRGNGLLGIYLNNLKDQSGRYDTKGIDPFTAIGYTGIRTYDWVGDKGYDNIGSWVEAAFKQPRK